MNTATVTMLFCDLVRSTELLGRLGDADAERVRQACFHALRGAVATTGGDEVKSLGDGLMVAFPSAVDGVRCAVGMHQAFVRLNRREPGLSLSLRVGLSVGEATSEGGDWFGTPVIEAARLCERAAPGQILATTLVEALTRSWPADAFVPAGHLLLKGLETPVPTVEVLWDSIDVSPVDLPGALNVASAGAFVGRDAELSRLCDAWSAAMRGGCRTAVVHGEPGIGKTRLAAELARRATADGGLVLYGRCDEDLPVPYQPFAEALRPAVTGRHTKDAVQRLGPAAARLRHLVPDIAAPVVENPVSLDPEADRYQMFQAAQSLLTELSRRAPLLLVLDDLHWAARPALLLLRHLVRSGAPMSALVVGTYRDTEVDQRHPLADLLADLRRDGVEERIALTGLGQDAVRSFVEATAGPSLQGQGGDVADAVHRETNGNPFFMGEVVRHLMETGVRYADVSRVGLPDGVREVVTRRLSRLSPEASRVLEVAAVCGPQVSTVVLEEIADARPADSSRSVLDGVDEALRAGVLVEVDAGVVEFAHALVRQTLYWGLSGARRVHLHRQVGEVLERSHWGSDQPALLAYHFGEAAPEGGATKAIDYTLAAADDALRRLAVEEAADLLRTGLGVLDRHGPADPARHCELLVRLAEALHRTWEWKEARDVAEDAAREARALGAGEQLARAAIVRGMATSVGANDDIAVELCDEALVLLGDAHPELRASILATRVSYGVATRDQGDSQTQIADEALRLARDSGDITALADALFAQALARRLSGRHNGVVVVCDELIALGEAANDPLMRMSGLVDRARAWLALGDRAAYDRDRAALSELGIPLRGQYERWARNYDTVTALLDGRFGEVEALAEHAMATVEHPNPNDINVHAAQILLLYREQGRMPALISLLEDMVEREPGIVAFRAALAVALAEHGRNDDASHHLDVLAVDGYAALPLDVTWMSSLALVAECSALLSRPAHADRLATLLGPHEGTLLVAASTVGVLGAADRFLGMLAAVCGRDDEAIDRYERAIALEERVHAPPLVARTKFWAAGALDRCGQRDRAAKLREEAEGLAVSLGMERVVVA